MLGVDDRAPPACVPLVGTRRARLGVLLQQVRIGLVPLGALPAPGIEEHRPERLLTGIEGAATHPPLAAPLLARVNDAVGLVEVLATAGRDVPLGLLVGIETADVAAVGIAEVWVAVGDPLGDELGDRRALLDPHRRCAPQVGDLDTLTEHGVGIGGEAQQAIDRVADLGIAEHVHQLDRLLHLGVEVVVGEWQFGGAERGLGIARDVVGAHQDRPVGVAAHLHRARRLALVAEGVHVADDREGDFGVGRLEDVDRADVGHLVHGRGERDAGAGHCREPRAPNPAGDHHVLGLDATPVGEHSLHPGGSPGHRLGLDVDHLGVGEHLQDAIGDCLIAHRGAGGERIDHAHTGCEVTPEEDLGIDEGHHLLDLGWGDQPGVDAPGLRRGHPSLELLHPLGSAGDLDPAARGVQPVLFILLLALDGEERHLLVVIGRENEVRRVTGGATGVGQGALVEQHDVGPAETAEVTDQAVADDPGTDDHDPRLRWNLR